MKTLYKSVSEKVLYHARLSIAIDMCNKHKCLLEQALSNESACMFTPFENDRDFQVNILRELMKLEPELENVLKLYAEQ
jgi:hypothetical protein